MKSTNFNINSGKITKEPNPNVQVVDGFADFLTNLFTNFTKQYPQTWSNVKKITDRRVVVTLSSGGGNNLITLLPPKTTNNNIKAYQSGDSITIDWVEGDAGGSKGVNDYLSSSDEYNSYGALQGYEDEAAKLLGNLFTNAITEEIERIKTLLK
jgi:hypothetical protein